MPGETDTDDRPLLGQVAWVTGGGRGIGRVIALNLAAVGADICVVGRNADDLRTLADAARATGVRACHFAGDVREYATADKAVSECRARLGAVTFLVNNAGINTGSGVGCTVDPDDWWRTIEVNLKGPFNFIRAVLPAMVSAGAGRIVSMGSYVANSPLPFNSAYATSKAALLRLTDSVAAEVVGDGIQVFAVSPGWVWSDMTRYAEAQMRANIPDFDGVDPEFIFPPEAVAKLIRKIASGMADALSGRMIHVMNDLNTLIAQADEIIDKDRLALRFNP
jgi:NAD(P)-dependent dehydrogenase (short-subunit alcohol dehydrogenase family)